METLTFYLFAAIATLSGLMVVLQRRAVFSALALIVCLGSVAVLFFQLGAHFIGAVQVIVYAGAIMVLFLFVIMLQDPESEIFPANRLKRLLVFGLGGSALVGYVLFGIFLALPETTPGETAQPLQNTTLVAERLFREYLLPFEVTSVLILVAVIGAVVLAKRQD